MVWNNKAVRKLRQLYWDYRNARIWQVDDLWWQIEREKARLLAIGIDPVALDLYSQTLEEEAKHTSHDALAVYLASIGGGGQAEVEA